jgi:hypothetical protein
MKRFMFLSIGVLCLAVSALIGFHIGSQTAEAQTSETTYMAVAEGTSFHVIAIQPNGDVYRRAVVGSGWQTSDPPQFYGNYWWSSTVATQPGTWGGVKGKYNDKD